MTLIIDNAPQDRLVTDLYAWIVTDPRTGLEGVFGAKLGDQEFQCATSSIVIAQKMGELIKQLPFGNKKFALVKFIKEKIIKEL